MYELSQYTIMKSPLRIYCTTWGMLIEIIHSLLDIEFFNYRWFDNGKNTFRKSKNLISSTEYSHYIFYHSLLLSLILVSLLQSLNCTALLKGLRIHRLYPLHWGKIPPPLPSKKILLSITLICLRLKGSSSWALGSMSTPLLLLFPGPLWAEVVVPVMFGFVWLGFMAYQFL